MLRIVITLLIIAIVPGALFLKFCTLGPGLIKRKRMQHFMQQAQAFRNWKRRVTKRRERNYLGRRARRINRLRAAA